MSDRSRKSELEIAVSRLETKIDVMEMQLNSTTAGANRWPSRPAWRGLIRMAQQVVDEFNKEQDRATAQRSD